MKTRDNDRIDTRPTFQQRDTRPRGKGWLAGSAAIVVIVLVVGLSAFVFAQARQHGSTQASSTPAGGRWQLVLKGYSITSLVAASSDPADLYACATVAPAGSGQPGTGPLALLHSTDFGTHWRDVGKTAALSGSCQVAVHPANGDEVYVVTAAGNGQTSEVLKHSTNGGQTWETISPVLHSITGNETMPWYVQELHIAGNHLFALQWSLLENQPYIHQPPYGILSRVITSTDGGHNWTVFDAQLSSTHLGTFDYVVDPSNPNTVYELLGIPWLPPVAKTAGAADVRAPATGSNEQLYKTADGGATWHMLLDNLPFRSQVQIAASRPDIVYAGGMSNGPLPLAGQPNILPQSPAYPAITGAFQLHVSTDAGATWRDIAPPAGLFGLSNWFVTADGQLILGGLYAAVGSPTAPGTAVPVTPVTSTPQASVSIPGQATTSAHPYTQEQPLSSQAFMAAPSPYIQRYDPVANKWSHVVTPPAYGFVAEVTPGNTSAGMLLWYMGTNKYEVDLYRYVV
ncbi:MAG TPA: sialidase family protein [Ktedonobacteraceae bacterium]|nr:sialidase family protein [Ktedonobacteraceae bacterium]